LVANAAFYAFFGSFMLCLTIVLQSGLGMDPRSAGLTFAPLGVVFAAASVLGRPYVIRYGARVITLGAGISALAMAVLAVELVWLGGRADAAWMIGPMIFVGLGNGLALPALTGGVLAGVRGHHAGAAAGVLTTAQQFSSAVGVAILGTVFFGALGGTPGRGRFVDSLSLVLGVDAVLAVLTAGLAVALTAIARKQECPPITVVHDHPAEEMAIAAAE
jgi:MFS family permease